MALGSFRQFFGDVMVGRVIYIHRISVLTIELAESIVKVPEMAESITEGTLKQWSKRR